MSRKNNASKLQQLQVGDHVISYSVTYAKRKSISITVRADQRVDVRAPQGSDLEAIAEIIRKRASWILRHQQRFAQMPPKLPPPRPENGELYYVLGRPYRLKLEKVLGKGATREEVKLGNEYLTVCVKDPQDKARVEALLEKWCRQHAEFVFMRRMLLLLPRIQYLHTIPTLAIRRMKSRWGSCSTNGTITLNLKLVQLEESLIDYVIVHELCHLIEHNHSKQYYALLTRMMPDWRERRRRLNEMDAST